MKSRAVHVDLLRLFAAFQMVQGHTIDALLDDRVRHGAIYEAWDWVRGLTSVAFLFASGLAFHLASVARFEAHRADPGASRKRFLRALMLIAIGYLLHFPFGALGQSEAWQAALIVDVLQCIGVTLAVMEASILIARSPRQVVIVCGALALAAITLGPAVAGIAPAGPFGFALHYVTDTGGSLFPLVPWAGYMLAGVVVGQLASPAGSATPRARTALVLALLAATLLVVSLGGIHLRGALKLISYDVLKLAVVLAAGAVIALASLRVARLPRVAETLAGETLAMYVSHLLVCYGAGIGLVHLVGHTLSLPAAIAAAAGMVVATALFGVVWSRRKKWGIRPDRSPLAVRARTG